jgi:DNA invertase Pin-like site-specific DNA recombinase
MIVGYCSISIFEPAGTLETQRRHLTAFGAQKIFCERTGIFGKTSELERAIDFGQKGDLIVITRPYRVAHSTRGVLALIDRLDRKGVGFRILNTPVDTSTTTGRMILGSAPRWSLGMSPLRSLLWDLSAGWWRMT